MLNVEEIHRFFVYFKNLKSHNAQEESTSFLSSAFVSQEYHGVFYQWPMKMPIMIELVADVARYMA